MNQPGRPLQEYFDALRNESGISESEVRAVLERPMPSRSLRTGGAVAALLLVAAGAFFLVRAALMPEVPGVPEKQVQLAGPAASIDRAGTGIAVNGTKRDTSSPERAIADARPASGAGAGDERQTEAKFTEHSLQEKRPMKMRLRRNIATATTMGLLVVGVADSNAQMTHARQPEKEPAIVQQLADEVGITLSGYWQTKLNGYKERIDRMLSKEDLDALNRMRVRIAVLVADYLRRAEENGGTKMRDGAVKEDGKEMMAIYNATRELADRYRAGLKPISRTVSDDLVECVGVLRTRVEGFTSDHSAELSDTRVGAVLAKGLGKVDSVTTWFRSDEGQLMYGLAYSFVIEPVVMLYDGADLKMLLQQFQQMTKSRGGAGIQFDKLSPLPGVMLPEVSVLKQSVPNPARGSATIAYTLPKASTQSTLRIFDAQGSQVAVYERGGEAAGDHTVDVDLSSFAPGTYFYRLSVADGETQQVYSKTMQVVK